MNLQIVDPPPPYGSDMSRWINEQTDQVKLQGQVMTERMLQCMRRDRLAGFSVLLPSTYLAWLHWGRVDTYHLLMWWASVLFMNSITIIHSSAYMMRARDVAEMAAWRHRQMIIKCMSGVAWGSIFIWFKDDTIGVVDRAIVLIAVSSVAVIGLLPFRKTLVAFTAGVWVPTFFMMLTDGDPHHFKLGVGIAVLVISYNFYLWEASAQLVKGIEQRFQAEALAEALHTTAVRMHSMAVHDELTGLFNRRHGMQALNDLMHQHQRTAMHVETMGILLVDIDHFKKINDTYGHAIGDEVLKEISLRMQRNLRDSDVLSRIGGEEFMILIPHAPPQSLTVVAQRICSRIAEKPVDCKTHSLSVTISIGLAVVDRNSDAKTLLNLADQALYEAKHGGRNQVMISAKSRAALTMASGV
jgi:diguanylate cyclase (GGDEF)-like protein